MDLADRITKLSPKQRELFEKKLVQQGVDIFQPPIPPGERDRGNEFPLSFAQERLWFIQQLEEACYAYNILFPVHLEGMSDTVVLERSINE